MEVDIEICLNSVERAEVTLFANQFLIKCTSNDASGDLLNIIVRLEDDDRIGRVDHIVRDFLRYLAPYSNTIRRYQGVLRLGVFYNLEETVIFPFQLSCEAIKSIADLNLSIDATGYPCSPE